MRFKQWDSLSNPEISSLHYTAISWHFFPFWHFSRWYKNIENKYVWEPTHTICFKMTNYFSSLFGHISRCSSSPCAFNLFKVRESLWFEADWCINEESNKFSLSSVPSEIVSTDSSMPFASGFLCSSVLSWVWGECSSLESFDGKLRVKWDSSGWRGFCLKENRKINKAICGQFFIA